MNDDKTRILLFDGHCNMCSYLVTFSIKKDIHGKFKFAALQSDTGQALLKQYGLPINDFSSFVYICNNSYFLKSSAALHVLKELGGLWKLAYVFIFVPRPVRDFIYNILAKTRYKLFGRQNNCIMPTIEFKHRFIE
jgi:predicted DCC family thiol-disulfide oxidoreductase YuxK